MTQVRAWMCDLIMEIVSRSVRPPGTHHPLAGQIPESDIRNVLTAMGAPSAIGMCALQSCCVLSSIGPAAKCARTSLNTQVKL